VKMSSFLISKTEVTQGVWQKIMGTTPWRGKRHVKKGSQYAANYISWDEARMFCDKVGLELPTEAQWEFACGSGSSNKYQWGKSDSIYAWYRDNARKVGEKYVRKVGQKKSNVFGLYDVSGNVFEWCTDWYNKNYHGATVDPIGPDIGFYRVFRGGSYLAFRGYGFPGSSYHYVGFRLAMTWNDRARYVGAWENGKMHGQGTFTYAINDKKSRMKYEGEWKNNNKHGQGTYTWKNGNRYIGEFKNNQKIGRGTFIDANGNRYVGEFKKNKMNGRGTYAWKNGNRYVGEFKKNKKHGRGVYTWENGNRYVGEFKKNKIHGRGVYTWKNGNRYVGEFKNDKIHGRGAYTWKNGNRYVGEFKNNKKHGQGTEYNKYNTITLQGNWEYDKHIGP